MSKLIFDNLDSKSESEILSTSESESNSFGDSYTPAETGAPLDNSSIDSSINTIVGFDYNRNLFNTPINTYTVTEALLCLTFFVLCVFLSLFLIFKGSNKR